MIVQQFTGKQRVKTWSRFYFLICTALPDELLVAVFRHFGLKEIVGTLSKVSKRWWNISQTDGLWHSLPLDKWNVYHLTEAQFLNIVSHSRAFSHFSVLCRRQSIPVHVKWDTTKPFTSSSQADTLRFKRSANTYLKLFTKPKVWSCWSWSANS